MSNLLKLFIVLSIVILFNGCEYENNYKPLLYYSCDDLFTHLLLNEPISISVECRVDWFGGNCKKHYEKYEIRKAFFEKGCKLHTYMEDNPN